MTTAATTVAFSLYQSTVATLGARAAYSQACSLAGCTAADRAALRGLLERAALERAATEARFVSVLSDDNA